MRPVAKPMLIAGALALGLGTAGPASADTTPDASPCTGSDEYSVQSVVACHGYDYAEADNGGTPYIRVFDRECDDHAVYVEYYRHDDSNLQRMVDSDGCASGYDIFWGAKIDRFRVCENTDGCSGWKSVPS